MKKSKIKLIGILVIMLVFGFTMTGCGPFTNTHKISEYLSLASRVGRSAEGPLPLAVKINLDTDWNDLISTINSSHSYVNLDLSKCTMNDTVFNPGTNGSELIISIVLPDTVTKIEGNFNIFKNLMSIQFPASVKIDEINPFAGCSELTFNVKGKGDLSVIENGKALVYNGKELLAYPSATGSITINDVSVIGRSAFNSTSVEDVNLPNAAVIGIRAFSGCENLRTINIPAVTTIKELAFAVTGNTALAITLKAKIETIDPNLFGGVNQRKTVTIKVPNSDVENVTAMQNAFRGMGWSEGAILTNRTVLAADWQGNMVERIEWTNTNGYINIIVEGY